MQKLVPNQISIQNPYSKNLFETQLNIQKVVQNSSESFNLDSIVLEKPPIKTTERIKIYQDAYKIRLHESLSIDFEKVEDKIGYNKFKTIAYEYILTTPSRFRSLSEYSEGFPEFIRMNYPDLYLEAATDWLEILSMHAPSPTNFLSSDNVLNNVPFKLIISPTTISQMINNIQVTIFSNLDEFHLINLNEKQFKLLRFLEEERTLDEVTDFSSSCHYIDEEVISTIQEWITKNIIYCKHSTINP